MSLKHALARPVYSSALFHEFATVWHGLRQSMFSPYRPELHFMRGPGPKWHAKRAGRPPLFK